MNKRYTILYNATVDTSTAAGDRAVIKIPFKCTLKEVQVHIGNTEATAYVLAADKRTTIGSDTGRTEIDRITLPASDKSGYVYYVKDTQFGRVNLEPGQELVLETITASSATKAAVLVVLVEPDPETEANISKMVLSA